MALSDNISEKTIQDLQDEIKRCAPMMHGALVSLRDAVQTKNEETQKNCSDFLLKMEESHSRLSRMMASLEERKDPFGYSEYVSPAARETVEYKTFWSTIMNEPHELASGRWKKSELDPKSLRSWESKTLRTDSGPDGGYLLPTVTDNEIRKNITEISPVRTYARVRPLSQKSIEIARRLKLPVANFEGEGEEGDTDQSTYGSETVTCYRQTVTIPATLDMMISSAFDLELEISYDVGEAFGKNEATNFVKGLGVKGPQGFIKDPRIGSHQTAATGTLTWADIAAMTGQLKSGYSPRFFMNRQTLASLMAMTSSIGVPIWQPVAGGRPATIFGYPYDAGMIDLDNASGSGAKPLVFADMRRGYEIFDLIGISAIRDDLTLKKKAITEWTFRRYTTGRVVIPEAILACVIK